MEGAKACHLFPGVPKVKKKKKHTPSAVPPPADLICMCMAQRTMAELRACQLQRPAQSSYCLCCRCLRSHAAPSAASCGWGSAGAGLGGAGGGLALSSAIGGTRVGSGRFGAVVERRGGLLSVIWRPASCCRDYYLLSGTSETLVNRAQRREISSVWVQQQTPALSLNNDTDMHDASVSYSTLFIFSYIIRLFYLFKRHDWCKWMKVPVHPLYTPSI